MQRCQRPETDTFVGLSHRCDTIWVDQAAEVTVQTVNARRVTLKMRTGKIAKISRENNYGTTLPPLTLPPLLAATEARPYGKIRLNTNGWDWGKFSMARGA
jgi:hypothetical protein